MKVSTFSDCCRNLSSSFFLFASLFALHNLHHYSHEPSLTDLISASFFSLCSFLSSAFLLSISIFSNWVSCFLSRVILKLLSAGGGIIMTSLSTFFASVCCLLPLFDGTTFVVRSREVDDFTTLGVVKMAPCFGLSLPKVISCAKLELKSR